MQKAITVLKEKIASLLKFKKVTIVSDYDIDSCASASILWRILKKNNVDVEHVILSKGIENIVLEKIKKMNPEKIVIVDYVPGKDFAREIKNYPVTVLDLHEHEKYLDDVDYFTTTDYSKKYAALAYWLYVVSKEYDIINIEWLARLGCFWDKCMENTEFDIDDVYRKEMDIMLPFNLIVSFSQTRGASKMVEIFSSSNSFEIALENAKASTEYIQAKRVFDDELKNVMFSRQAYPDIKLNVYWVRTKFKHMRVFVDYITFTTIGTNVFVLDEANRFKFSLRTSLEINLVEIIRAISKIIPEFSGGGHNKACGAMLFNENVENLLNVFIEEYKKVI
jgi:hypothetical protein